MYIFLIASYYHFANLSLKSVNNSIFLKKTPNFVLPLLSSDLILAQCIDNPPLLGYECQPVDSCLPQTAGLSAEEDISLAYLQAD